MKGCESGWPQLRIAAACLVASMLRRVDAASADRIQPRDLKRIVRALEVFYLTGRPLTKHFADTSRRFRSSTCCRSACGCPPRKSPNVSNDGWTSSSRAGFSTRSAASRRAACRKRRGRSAGLVYRQALEHLHGVRDEASTRALITQENRRYARRQLIWFRKEPNLVWLEGPGESPDTFAAASALLHGSLERQRKTRARDISFRAEPQAPFALSCVVAVTAFQRAIVIVLDSVGIGELPDAAAYGDAGSDTIGNIARTNAVETSDTPRSRPWARGGHRRGSRRRRASCRCRPHGRSISR